MTQPTFVPFEYQELPVDEMRARAARFCAEMKRRRTIRHFSGRPVPIDIIERAVETAATAPSGANMQPWHFVIVGDPAVKRQIREAAEEEERAFYAERAPREWLEALAALGTDANKPFLEEAPYLIAIFGSQHGVTPEGRKFKHYYVQESVGIATGLLIVAIHQAGLVSLTHTPSPMGFLGRILGRPSRERPFLILVVGYPAAEATVPAITKKPLSEIVTRV